jgi:SAM-dependent methyltransferase
MYDPHMVLPRNQKTAAVWDSAAGDYERVSLHLGDAIDHTIGRLAPRPGERILDIGTGTGLAARRVALCGAAAVGVDLGAELIEAARRLAPTIDFRVGDAEQLPFEDASFDGAISTFGIMFVNRQETAAAELARVCRKGARIALASWQPDSSVARKFAVHRPYLPPSAGPSPFEWGRPDGVRRLLDSSFDLKFESGLTMLRLSSSEEAWELFVRGYGPTRTLAESLTEERRQSFRRDFLAYYEAYRTDLGIAVPREYLLALGLRR